jgi:hypothetical protein
LLKQRRCDLITSTMHQFSSNFCVLSPFWLNGCWCRCRIINCASTWSGRYVAFALILTKHFMVRRMTRANKSYTIVFHTNHLTCVSRTAQTNRVGKQHKKLLLLYVTSAQKIWYRSAPAISAIMLRWPGIAMEEQLAVIDLIDMLSHPKNSSCAATVPSACMHGTQGLTRWY